MAVDAEFVPAGLDEAIFSMTVEEDAPHLVMNYVGNQPIAIVVQCLERGQGALLFGLDGGHIEQTDNGIALSEELLCFESLLRYIPTGLQGRYEIETDEAGPGTWVITPQRPIGYNN